MSVNPGFTTDNGKEWPGDGLPKCPCGGTPVRVKSPTPIGAPARVHVKCQACDRRGNVALNRKFADMNWRRLVANILAREAESAERTS